MSILYGSLLPKHGACLGCGWRRWPPDMENSANILK